MPFLWWKGERGPKPVAPQRASALLSACAAQEGWFYARSIGDVLGACCELGELLWLSFQHPDAIRAMLRAAAVLP